MQFNKSHLNSILLMCSEFDNKKLYEWLLDDEPYHGSTIRIIVESNGIVEYEEWWEKHKRHRVDGPAYRRIINGIVDREEWWENGQRHCVGGPAIIWYDYSDVFVDREEWWWYGEREEWWWYGEMKTPEEHRKECKQYYRKCKVEQLQCNLINLI